MISIIINYLQKKKKNHNWSILVGMVALSLWSVDVALSTIQGRRGWDSVKTSLIVDCGVCGNENCVGFVWWVEMELLDYPYCPSVKGICKYISKKLLGKYEGNHGTIVTDYCFVSFYESVGPFFFSFLFNYAILQDKSTILNKFMKIVLF